MSQDRRRSAGRVAGEGGRQDPAHPAGRSVILPISASTWARARRVWPRASGAASSIQLPPALARVCVEAAGLAGVEGGRVGQDHPALGAERRGGVSQAVRPPNRSWSTSW